MRTKIVQQIANDSVFFSKGEKAFADRMLKILQHVSQEPYNVIGTIACQTMELWVKEKFEHFFLSFFQWFFLSLSWIFGCCQFFSTENEEESI